MAKDRWDNFGKKMREFGRDMSRKMEEFQKEMSENFDDDDFSFSSSKSVQVSNGIKVVTETKNGKSKITINGEEVVPKKYADGLLEQVEIYKAHTGHAFIRNNQSVTNYKKYLEKRK